VTEAVITSNGASSIVDQVVIKGNLAELTPRERVTYYAETCRSLGLNPLTKPYEFISLSGKLVLYATRGATDQLRQLHNVAITGLVREKTDDLYLVTATARLPDGRTDESIGAVSIRGLSGDALANACMKAETKAKRRVTLSIVGLGWLDETEVETIRDAQPIAVDQETGEIAEVPRLPAPAKINRPAIEKRYRELVDRADALGVPADNYQPGWSDDVLTDKGKRLLAAIHAKEAQIPAK
jgi:hypothetical protein